MSREREPEQEEPFPLPRQPGDPVPRLRRDLRITPNARGPILFDAVLPESERVLGLYEYEVSIARMLDGRRPAGALVDAARHIGIPLSLESLGTFLRRLQAYDFLEPPGAPPAEGAPAAGPWPPRERWSDEVRALFQQALRSFRDGHLDPALGHLEALEKLQPDLPDTHALRARIVAQKALQVEASLRAPSVPGRRRASALVVAFGIAAVLAVLGVPLPFTVRADVTFEPVVLLTVAAPHDGRVLLGVEDGAPVEEGEPLARLVPEGIAEERAQVQAALATLEAQRQQAVAKASGEEAKRWERALAKARRRLERARGPGARALREREVETARAAWRERSGADEVARIEDGQEALAGRLAALEQAAEGRVLRAQRSGRFEALIADGAPVRSGEGFGRIVDVGRMRARIPLGPSELPRVTLGRPVVLELPSGGRLHTEVSAVEIDTGGLGHAEVGVTLGAAEAPGSARAIVRCQPAPLLSHLLGMAGL